jgi:hypothetical protein
VTDTTDGLRFYVDENTMGLGKVLARARYDTVHPGHRLLPEVPPGTLDTVWMPAVAARQLVVIGRDRHIRTRPGEVALLRQHGLRVFRIAGRRDLGTWGYLVRLVRHWDEMEDVIATRGPGPWFMAIYDARIVELPV